eukprot:scaffold78514_cov21-Tisochrysis_lutea.AAC.3
MNAHLGRCPEASRHLSVCHWAMHLHSPGAVQSGCLLGLHGPPLQHLQATKGTVERVGSRQTTANAIRRTFHRPWQATWLKTTSSNAKACKGCSP